MEEYEYSNVRRDIVTTFIILFELFLIFLFWNVLFPFDEEKTVYGEVYYTSFGSIHIFFNLFIIVISVLTGLIGYDKSIDIKKLFGYGKTIKRKID